jgi:hypothetical protein
MTVEHRDGWDGHYGHSRPVRHWYYRGFALRLGWGDPAYGYPWGYPTPPIVSAPAPHVLVPAPLVRGPAPPTGAPEWYSYCATRYRSFEPDTGLYTTYSGRKRMCQ